MGASIEDCFGELIEAMKRPLPFCQPFQRRDPTGYSVGMGQAHLIEGVKQPGTDTWKCFGEFLDQTESLLGLRRGVDTRPGPFDVLGVKFMSI